MIVVVLMPGFCAKLLKYGDLAQPAAARMIEFTRPSLRRTGNGCEDAIWRHNSFQAD